MKTSMYYKVLFTNIIASALRLAEKPDVITQYPDIKRESPPGNETSLTI